MQHYSNNYSRPSFQQYQQQFVDYLRDPKNDLSLSDSLPEASKVYAELLNSTIDDCLRTCFPVCQEILGDEIWQQLVALFIKDHICETPLYREIPNEFMAYLINEKPAIELPEFMLDLAHYEWIELILETEEANEHENSFPILVKPSIMIPVLNPVLLLLHYRYPVQSISASNEEWKNWQVRKESYEQKAIILAGYRDKHYKVKFVELNSITARLIEILQKQTRNQEHVLLQLSDEINYRDPKKFMIFGMDILQQLAEQQIIIGAVNEE